MLTPLLLTLALASAPQDALPQSMPAAYDPLEVPAGFTAKTLDLVFTREVKQGWKKKTEREVPLFIYLPETEEPAPVVLFSHGLGGERTGSVGSAPVCSRTISVLMPSTPPIKASTLPRAPVSNAPSTT